MKKLALIICGFVAAAGFTACDNGDNTSLLNIRIIKILAEKTYNGADVNPDSAAVAVRIAVSGPGMDTVSEEALLSTQRTLKVPEFSEGYDRQISFEFLGAADPLKNNERPVIGRGRSASLDMWADEARAPDRIFVSPVDSLVRPFKIDNNSGETVPSVPERADRVGATATELDDGRILICGGAQVKDGAATWYKADDLYNLTDTCETYNPRTGEFVTLPARMTVKRAYHQALKLGSPNNPDGRVVLIGGYTVPDGGTITVTPLIDIFNPSTGTFISATDGKTGYGLPGGAGRALFTADVINPDSNIIIVVGGVSNYKQAGGTYDILWITEGAAIVLAHDFTKSDDGKGTVRFNHAMVRVKGYANKYTNNADYEAYLLIGGENDSGVINNVEPYVITCASRKACKIQRQDSLITSIPEGGRTMAKAIYDKLHNFVFIAGGFKGAGGANPTSRVEAFRVPEGGFRSGEYLQMNGARGDVQVAEMDSGKFLLSGGWNGSEFVDAMQVLSPKGPVIQNGKEIESPSIRSDVPAMESARGGHIAITDQTGRVLLFGGVDNSGASPDPIMYNPLD